MVSAKEILKNKTRLEKRAESLERRIDKRLRCIEPDVDIVKGVITFNLTRQDSWDKEVIEYVLKKYLKGGYHDASYQTSLKNPFSDEDDREDLEIKLIL